uniref:G_PROTEIN_RECEP_F1_2 domain-containing protein n=1 Tax=Haemonchus contortus TaxID=6289 RepID=A0A7I4YI58_HAECO
MEKADMMSITFYAIAAVGLIGNVLLLILYFRCPLKKTKSYKYFFLISAIQDIVYSVTFVLLRPRIIAQSSSLIMVATGMVRSTPFASYMLVLFATIYICSIVLVTNSFVYRYLCLCRAHFFQTHPTRLSVLVGFSSNFLVILNFFVFVYLLYWPNKDFDQLIWSTVEIPGFKLDGIAVVGVSMKYNMSGIQFALVIDVIIVMASMVLINVFCAVKIHCYLKSGARISRSFSLQRRMFVLLQLQ